MQPRPGDIYTHVEELGDYLLLCVKTDPPLDKLRKEATTTEAWWMLRLLTGGQRTWEWTDTLQRRYTRKETA